MIHLQCVDPTDSLETKVYLCQPLIYHSWGYSKSNIDRATHVKVADVGVTVKIDRFRLVKHNREIKWITKKKEEIKLKDLDDDHLKNIKRILYYWKRERINISVVDTYLFPIICEVFYRKFHTKIEETISNNYEI